MKIKVDKAKCIGCGVCADVAENVFVLKGDYSEVKQEEFPEDEKETVTMAMECCPVSAISMKI